MLRIRADALILRNEMTKAQARSAFLILQQAAIDLGVVVDRGKQGLLP